MKNELSSIPVIILAGGNTVSFTGEVLPKASVRVGGSPLLFHVIDHYRRAGFANFIICLGDGYDRVLQDLESLEVALDLGHRGEVHVEPLFTGGVDQTGSRLLQAMHKIGSSSTVALSYVDTISDVNLADVYAFHRKQRKTVTLTAVNLPTRFRVLGVNLFSTLVRGFSKMPLVEGSPILGGYFFLERSIAQKFSKSVKRTLSFENDILPKLVVEEDVVFFKHDGYWQFIDSQRDIKTAEQFLLEQG